MPLLELDDDLLPSDGKFDLLDIAVEGGSGEEGDVDMRLTGKLALVCVVVRWVWFEHDEASSNEIELVVVAGDVKAAGSLGSAGAGVADEGTMGESQGSSSLAVGSKERTLGTERVTSDPRISTSTSNISLATRSCLHSLATARPSSPERVSGLTPIHTTVRAADSPNETDASDIRARPLHPLDSRMS